MSKREGVERAVESYLHRISGKTAAALALLLYPGIGLIVPLALGWPTFYLVWANLVGTVFAAVVSLGWFSAQLDAADRRHLIEWTTDLRLLDPTEFEWLVGEMFRREGWTVKENGQPGEPDGNIDLELMRDGERKIVQCKRWETQLVGVDEIRRFLGTLMREKLPSSAGIYVTLSRYGELARKEADQAGMALIDNRQLLSRIEKVQRQEACPLCQSPMVLGRSPHGWWFRCVNGCPGKRNLSNEPGRAVELLTQPL